MFPCTKIFKWIFVSTLLFTCNVVQSQNIDEIIPDHPSNISFIEFIKIIEEEYHYKFFFKPEWVDNIVISKSYSGQNLQNALIDILYIRDIRFQFLYGYAIVLVKDYSKKYLLDEIVARGDSIEHIHIGDPLSDGIDNIVKLKGVIRSSEQPNLPLSNIEILINGKQLSVSRMDGSYEVELTSGNHVVGFNGTDREARYVLMSIFRNGDWDIELQQEAITLSEVVIREQLSDENFDYSVAGKTKIGISDINTNPTFLGEVDVIKSIQNLAGVSSTNEIGAGINVRGGSADQNLILYDKIMIFNPTHLFGFFSAFHPDAVKDVSFYKGTIPAEFGGRLSSVLDVSQREGDFSDITMSGGIGIVSSRLLVDGPIIKDKLSFLIGARASYSDWILKRVKDLEIRNSSANFSDYTAKISFKPSKSDKLTLSTYLSLDQFQFASDTVYKWSNRFISLSHNHAFNNKLSSELNVGTGKYAYSVSSDANLSSFEWDYSIRFLQFDAKIRHETENQTIVFGVDGKGYDMNNGHLKPLSAESSVEEVLVDKTRSYELALFASDEIKLSSKLTLLAGLRYSTYTLLGPNKVFQYQSGKTRDNSTIIDTTYYETNERIVSYHGLEPRLSLKYQFTSNSQMKLGYSRGYQYIHLISNTASITPIDIWITSNAYIEPQYGDQYSIGYSKRFQNEGISLETDVFYKQLHQIPEYKNGAELILNPNIETELVKSEGRAYGFELSAKKTKGRLKGQLNYTYSKSERKTNTIYEDLIINNGRYFNANYDQPHNLTVNTNYAISKRHTLAVNFLVASGRPYTSPTSSFVVDNTAVVNFGDRNLKRMPLYHRLDLSLLVKSNYKKSRWRGSWAFTLYNVYARKNAYSIFFESNENNKIQAKKLSILGTIFPAITYNFKF